MAPWAYTQNVGIGTNNPKSSAALDITSPNKGLLMPRLTSAQRKAIVNPETGLMVFDMDKNTFYYYNGRKWAPLAPINDKFVPSIELGSGSSSNIEFGFSVGIFGDFIAVGMPSFDTLSTNNCGGVRIYRKINNEWVVNQTIIAPDFQAEAFFGRALDMHGLYLIIGAPDHNPSNISNGGHAYIYRRNESTHQYILEATLAHTNGAKAETKFGFSVGIASNSTILGGVAAVVGCPRYFNDNGTNIFGSASFYRRGTDGTWLHTNTENGSQINESYGHAVAIDSTLAVVGAPSFDDASNASVGRVEVRRLSNNNFATLDGQIATATDTSRQLGYAVAVDSSLILVAGASGSSTINSPVRLFRRTGVGTYSQITSVSPILSFEDGQGSLIGNKLAISRSLFLIGVPHRSFFAISSATDSGNKDYALIFQRTSSSWGSELYRQEFEPSNRNDTRMGQSVAAHGKNFVIGMPNAIGANGFGSIFVGTSEE